MGLGTFLSHSFNDVSQWAGDTGTFGKRIAGDAVGGVEKVPVVGAIVHDVGHGLTNLAQWDRDAYSDVISRPIATFGLVGENMNNWGDAVKGGTWSKSWNESAHVSPGEAFAANVESTFNLDPSLGQTPAQLNAPPTNKNLAMAFSGSGATASQANSSMQKILADPNATNAYFKHGPLAAKLLSGSYDAFLNWNADPSVLAGSGISGFRKAGSTVTALKGTKIFGTERGAVTAEAAARNAAPRVAKFLDATDKLTAYQAKRLPTIAKSDNPDLLASIFNHTVDRGVRENAYKMMISGGFDTTAAAALEEIAANAAETAPTAVTDATGAAVTGGATAAVDTTLRHWGSLSDAAAGALEGIANAGQKYNPEISLANVAGMHGGDFGWDALKTALHGAADDAQKKLALPGTKQRMIQDVLEMNGHVTWQPGRFDVPIAAMRDAFKTADSFGDISKITQHIPGADTAPGRWVTQVLYKGINQTPLKVFRAFGDKWPDGWMDYSSNKAGDTLEAFLNRAKGMTSADRAGYMNQFYEAGSDAGKRSLVVQAAEHAASVATLVARGADSEDAAAIMAATYRQRIQKLAFADERVQRPGTQAFSAAKDAAGQAVDLVVHGIDEDDGAAQHYPILATMRRQGTPLIDLDNLNDWAGQNLGKFQTIKQHLGTAENAITNTAELFNGIWKNGVLLRLGFTPRVMTDMGLRTLVTLGSMRTLGLVNEASKVALHNVGASGYDYANRLLKNRLFDPGTMKAYADKEGILTTARDNARVDYLDANMQKIANDEGIASGLPHLEGTPDDSAIAALKQHFDAADERLASLRVNASPYTKARLADGKLKIKGVSMTDLFGGEDNNFLREQVSSDRSWGRMFSRNVDMEKGMSGSGAWDTIRAQSQNEQEAGSHLKAWRHAVNNQIMNDQLGSKVVRNNWNESDIRSWLHTPEGKSYLQYIPGNFHANLADYSSRVASHVHYTVPPAVREEITNTGAKGISTKKLESLVPDLSERPDVNGQLLNMHLASGAKGITNGIQQFQHWSHKWLGAMPLNTFVMHPTAVGFYRAHMSDLVDKYISHNGLDDAKSLDFNPALQQRMEKQAFSLAKNDVWSIMYDMSQRSTAAHMLRFMFPFMSAQQEIIKNWFNIALDHPQILQREQQIWNSPAQAGMLYDSTTGDPADKNTPLENQVVRFQIPHAISSLPGLGVLNDMGQMQIAKGSLNPILQGQHFYVPGAGPIVQVGVQALSKLNPGIMDNSVLKQVIPYGPGDNLAGAILPTWASRLETGFSVNNPQYSTTFAKVYQAETIRYNEGLRTAPPTMGEMQARTQQLLLIQALGSAVLPFSAQFNPGTQAGKQKPRAAVTSGLEAASAPDLSQTPIQGLIDQYKKMESVDPANAANSFYNKYGQALFAVTASTSKANAAVPATAAGLAAIDNPEIRAMIQADPSVAYAIVGPTQVGASFDMAAYQAEMNTQIGGGDTQTFRQKLDPADIIKENQAQLGWQQYDQLMSSVQAKMSERGITSLSDSNAQDLRTYKDQFLANMNDPTSQDYNPDWYQQYTGAQTDWNARIQSLTALVSDTNLVNNPGRSDLRVLGQYLQYRQEVNQSLAERPNKEGLPTTLADKQNADLAATWDQIVSGLVMSNTNFALIYQHLLTGDPVNSNLKSNVQFQAELSGQATQ
jgi:hypothetical protein